jgi:uncharacterized coiled-coil DUF342 family protein
MRSLVSVLAISLWEAADRVYGLIEGQEYIDRRLVAQEEFQELQTQIDALKATREDLQFAIQALISQIRSSGIALDAMA